MTIDLKYFLLEYNRRTRDLVVSEFIENEEATAVHNRTERNRLPEVEVVLFMARSLDDLKVTHSRFFKSFDELIGDLQATVAADIANRAALDR
jgi:hypothetical protein